jgi:AbrB family looped-hinge helix DNA binding protein
MISLYVFREAIVSTVTLSSKYQIVIPQAAREALSLSAGDELLVLCKSDRVVIIPKPKKFAKRTRGLHSEVWQGAEAYLNSEREGW